MKNTPILQRLFRPGRALERQALQKAYRSVFSGAAGQLVLDDLCAGFKLSHSPGKGEGNMADVRAFQDGRDDVLLHILKMLEG